MRYLPLADVMMISSTRLAVTTVLSCVFLKEACGAVEIINLLLTLSGVFLVVQPPAIFSSGVAADQQVTLKLCRHAI